MYLDDKLKLTGFQLMYILDYQGGTQQIVNSALFLHFQEEKIELHI